MSNAPYLVQGARDGLRFGHASMQDSMIQDGLWDAFNDYHMGITAENLADAFDISRPQQDAFAALSQRKAAAAIAAGRFQAEIVPLSVPQGKKRRAWWTQTNNRARKPANNSWRSCALPFARRMAASPRAMPLRSTMAPRQSY